jgi:hypothetical protein
MGNDSKRDDLERVHAPLCLPIRSRALCTASESAVRALVLASPGPACFLKNALPMSVQKSMTIWRRCSPSFAGPPQATAIRTMSFSNAGSIQRLMEWVCFFPPPTVQKTSLVLSTPAYVPPFYDLVRQNRAERERRHVSHLALSVAAAKGVCVRRTCRSRRTPRDDGTDCSLFCSPY